MSHYLYCSKSKHITNASLDSTKLNFDGELQNFELLKYSFLGRYPMTTEAHLQF